MNSLVKGLLIGLTGVVIFAGQAIAHCEIPCGIYDDHQRIEAILEDITTIEKAMDRISALEKADPPNANQLVRWVTNKEEHANRIQEIVSQYFMTQRIAPGDEKYQEKLTTLHKMLLAAMHSKQTTDPQHTRELRALVNSFETLYFKEKHDH